MSSFLRRLFDKPESTASEAASPLAKPIAPTSAPAAETKGTDDTSAPAPLSPAATVAAAPADALDRELRTDFTSAMRTLEEELTDQHRRSSDLALFMHALGDDAVSGVRQLPVAAQRALALLQRDASTNELVKLFERDPAMTQALLQQVNSAFYNPSGARVGTLTAAITRMGRASIQSVVMQQTVAGMVSRPGGVFDAMAQQVWNHMVRVAPIARLLAPVFGAKPELAFLLGLMHDVGKLVVFDRISELRTAQRRLINVDAEVVSRALRLLHEPLGGLLIQQWGLDADIARAVAAHHRNPVAPMHDALCETVYLAERVDLLQERKEAPDLGAIWQTGVLTGDIAMAARLLELPEDAPA